MKPSLFAIAIVLFAGWTATGTDRPNLIWIMADDLGYGELGCYGQSVIATPNLDRMAAQGMRFTQCYAGATVCAPSRSVLMTGQHHGHTRVRGNAGDRNPAAQALRSDDTTVAGMLQLAGYRTALIGKWGLGDVGPAETGLPRKQGFDEFFGYLNQHHAHNHFRISCGTTNSECRCRIRLNRSGKPERVMRLRLSSMPTICLPMRP